MSNNHQPNQTDRIVSHVIVGLLVGLVVGKQTGKWGFVVGVLAGAGAHELLDAPVANVVADFAS